MSLHELLQPQARICVKCLGVARTYLPTTFRITFAVIPQCNMRLASWVILSQPQFMNPTAADLETRSVGRRYGYSSSADYLVQRHQPLLVQLYRALPRDCRCHIPTPRISIIVEWHRCGITEHHLHHCPRPSFQQFVIFATLTAYIMAVKFSCRPTLRQRRLIAL